ncbi:flavoprotein [Planctomycetales bacterium]|nr:flavoprotein [Planctomycetales bacterium]
MDKPKILITSGPTREYLDPVRFISNSSSGKMGAALAAAVLKKNAVPVIVSGNVSAEYPAGAEVHYVETTEEMQNVCLEHFPQCAGIIGAAAPCDFTPLQFLPQKISKKDMTGGILTLQLTATPDILAALGKIKRGNQFIVCFALETADGENGKENAMRKLKEKNADYVILNKTEAIRSDYSTVQVFDRGGYLCSVINGGKNFVAEKILAFVLRQD